MHNSCASNLVVLLSLNGSFALPLSYRTRVEVSSNFACAEQLNGKVSTVSSGSSMLHNCSAAPVHPELSLKSCTFAPSADMPKYTAVFYSTEGLKELSIKLALYDLCFPRPGYEL